MNAASSHRRGIMIAALGAWLAGASLLPAAPVVLRLTPPRAD